jgi:hypothetical protein
MGIFPALALPNAKRAACPPKLRASNPITAFFAVKAESEPDLADLRKRYFLAIYIIVDTINR